MAKKLVKTHFEIVETLQRSLSYVKAPGDSKFRRENRNWRETIFNFEIGQMGLRNFYLINFRQKKGSKIALQLTSTTHHDHSEYATFRTVRVSWSIPIDF